MSEPDPALSIDLNSDLGEGFGAYSMGDDDAILKIVTSANVACGLHAGDPEIMARVFGLARQRGVKTGAHPGLPDLWGFGRRVIPFSAGEIERLVAYQIGAAQALSAYCGNPITYVKAHGALSHMAYTDVDVAKAIGRAMKAVDDSLVCLTFPNGHMPRVAQELGLRVSAEIFADRGYTEEGTLVPRQLPGALLRDPKAAAARALRMVRGGGVETLSGRLLPMKTESICVHSDTPGAVEMAAEVRRTLEAAGIVIRAFV
jgi:5-oxoprolinase (ATP-hydrolysing) subunit A